MDQKHCVADGTISDVKERDLLSSFRVDYMFTEFSVFSALCANLY